ncbi:hypothetical protein GCM10010532_035440 [Dactylosporangium siamense]
MTLSVVPIRVASVYRSVLTAGSAFRCMTGQSWWDVVWSDDERAILDAGRTGLKTGQKIAHSARVLSAGGRPRNRHRRVDRRCLDGPGG